MVVISDKKIGVDVAPQDGIIDYYNADVISAQDYYPGGMQMPGRNYSAGNDYRYGFNGKEEDDEVKGDGNQQDYGFRIYDPRLVRFLSVDPLTKDYPWYTPYQFAGNKTIWAVDLDGLEELISQYLLKDGKATLIQKVGNIEFRQKPAVHFKGNTYPQTGFYDQYNKATGKPFTEAEKGTEQFQYFDEKGNRLNIRRDIGGNYVPGENENISIYTGNAFGSIYIGKDNPKTGDGQDDYRREPQDLEDAGALEHDLNYDKVGAKGVPGAMSKKTLNADITLVLKSQEVIDKRKEKAKDPYTGKPVSEKTAIRAKLVKAIFTVLAGSKL